MHRAHPSCITCLQNLSSLETYLVNTHRLQVLHLVITLSHSPRTPHTHGAHPSLMSLRYKLLTLFFWLLECWGWMTTMLLHPCFYTSKMLGCWISIMNSATYRREGGSKNYGKFLWILISWMGNWRFLPKNIINQKGLRRKITFVIWHIHTWCKVNKQCADHANQPAF